MNDSYANVDTRYVNVTREKGTDNEKNFRGNVFIHIRQYASQIEEEKTGTKW